MKDCVGFRAWLIDDVHVKVLLKHFYYPLKHFPFLLAVLGLKVRFDYCKKECKFVNLASIMLFDIDSLNVLGFHTTCSALVHEHNALINGDCKFVTLLKAFKVIPIRKKNVPFITYVEL